VDGQKNPGGMFVRDESEVPEGWVFVTNDEPWPENWRYDAANRVVRPPTNAELVADARVEKKAELAQRMHEENRKLYPEVALLDGAWIAEALIDIVTDPRGTRVAAVKANRDRRARGYTAADDPAKTTVAAVQAVTWEGV